MEHIFGISIQSRIPRYTAHLKVTWSPGVLSLLQGGIPGIFFALHRRQQIEEKWTLIHILLWGAPCILFLRKDNQEAPT